MQVIDIDTWVRKDNYHFYKGFDNPLFQLCAEVDITKLLPLVKKKDYSFYQVMIFFTMKAVNSVKEFKTRIQSDRVVQHNSVHAAPVFLGYDEQVRYCMLEDRESLTDFLQDSAPVVERTMRENWHNKDGRDDLIYITCIPWVSFTAFNHPMNYGDKCGSAPTISWGKYKKSEKEIKLPYSVVVHHSLADGLHVGRFFNKLQELLDSPEEYFTI